MRTPGAWGLTEAAAQGEEGPLDSPNFHLVRTMGNENGKLRNPEVQPPPPASRPFLSNLGVRPPCPLLS